MPLAQGYPLVRMAPFSVVKSGEGRTSGRIMGPAWSRAQHTDDFGEALPEEIEDHLHFGLPNANPFCAILSGGMRGSGLTTCIVDK